MKPYQPDALERRIIAAVQEDADLSAAELGERVGASSASCWRRVRALEEAGVLRKTVRLVDTARLGRDVNVVCQVRLRGHTADLVSAFESFVCQLSEVMECLSMSGEWDYLLRVVVGDVAEYERFLMRGLLTHPSVANAASHFALSRVKYTTVIALPSA